MRFTQQTDFDDIQYSMFRVYECSILIPIRNKLNAKANQIFNKEKNRTNRDSSHKKILIDIRK